MRTQGPPAPCSRDSAQPARPTLTTRTQHQRVFSLFKVISAFLFMFSYCNLIDCFFKVDKTLWFVRFFSIFRLHVLLFK